MKQNKTSRIFSIFLTSLILLSLSSCTKKIDKTEAQVALKGQIKIASMSPASTEILSALGLAGHLVAIDTWSASVEGVPASAVQFDMMKPDAERLAALEPDLLLVSEMTKAGTNTDPFAPLRESGIQVVYLKTALTIEDIRGDIRALAELAEQAGLIGTEKKAETVIAIMDEEIAKIAAISATIPADKRKTVMFEIAAAPYIYSFGSGVYLDELLTTVGAVNILGDQTGWLSVSGETIVAANPSVILTNIHYIDDPVAEICSRPGWETLSAVRENRVYRIDSNTSSQPAPGIITALKEIAQAVYPEYFSNL